MLRLRLRVPSGLISSFRALPEGQTRLMRDLGERVARLGYERPLALLQDPTNASRVVAITRPRMSRPYPGDDTIVVESVEGVEDPRWRAASERPEGGDRWPKDTGRSEEYEKDDPGMLDAEISAVRHALRNEHHPKHLRGFASTLDGWFPVAASLLRARVGALEPGSTLRMREMKDSPRPSDGYLDRMREELRSFASGTGMPEEVVRTIVRRAACQLVEGEPSPSVVLARFPPPIRNVARAIVRPVGDYADGTTLSVVDANAARRVMPPTGREGFVSPQALWLAMSMSKPEVSMVSDRDVALRRGHDLEDRKPPADPRERTRTLLAQAMLDKARRTLERQRWVEWYHSSVPLASPGLRPGASHGALGGHPESSSHFPGRSTPCIGIF